MQTTLPSADDSKVHPKRPEKGGRRCGYPKQRNEAKDSPTTSYWGWSRWKEGPRLNRQKGTLTERKAEEISTNAEGKCRNPNRRLKRYQGKCKRSRQNQNWRHNKKRNVVPPLLIYQVFPIYIKRYGYTTAGTALLLCTYIALPRLRSCWLYTGAVPGTNCNVFICFCVLRVVLSAPRCTCDTCIWYQYTFLLLLLRYYWVQIYRSPATARQPPLLLVIRDYAQEYQVLLTLCLTWLLCVFLLRSALPCMYGYRYRYVLSSCSPAVARPPPLLLVVHSSTFSLAHSTISTRCNFYTPVACKNECRPFNPSYSQQTFFIFLLNKKSELLCLPGTSIVCCMY